jgi:branched-chain amino acid transport system substrate-binding protein
MKKLIILGLALIMIWGCGNQKSEVVKLGATFPLTGDVASYGINAKNGIELRFEEFNNAGGLNGRKIEIDFQDDKNSIKDAVSIFNSFTTIKKYPLVFGSAGSSVSLALVPIANKEKTVLFSPVSSSSKLSTEGGLYFFRTVPSDNIQAEILAEWVWSDSIKTVAIVYTNNSWGKPLSDAFIELFQAKGGKIVFTEGVSENVNDFRTIIVKLKQYKFDAIISPTYPREGGLFVKQLKENGMKTKLFGGDNWGAPEFLQIAGNAADGACFTFPSDSKSILWDGFAVRYKKRYGVEPDIISAYAYDAASAVIIAMKNAESVTGVDLRKQLTLVNVKGVSGLISFKENGDINLQGFGKKTIINGTIQTINQ